MATTTNRGYPIPDPAGAIHPGVRDLAAAIDADLGIAFSGFHNVKHYGAAGDGGTNDRNALNTLLNSTLPNGGDVYFPPGDYLHNSAMTYPANTRLWFARGARLKPANGVTIPCLSAIADTPFQIFTNILSGQGIVSFANNRLQRVFRGAWYGMVGDDTTDCTAIWQRILDQFSADDLSAILKMPAGTVLIAGALQDTSFSNSQIIVPKRTIADGQLSLYVEGEGVPSPLIGTDGDSGTVLRSSLASGNGAMIGCKVSGETFNASQLNLWFQNLTFKMPQNPTNTCLDMRYLKRFFMRGFKIYATNWDNTEPTTSSSFGLRTPDVNVVSDCGIEDGVVGGFYKSIEANELAYFNNVEEGPSIYGWNFPHNIHPTTAHRIGSFFSRHTVRVTGEATIAVDMLHIERPAVTGKWYSVANQIDDFSESTAGYAHGRIGYLISDSNASPPGPVNNAFIVTLTSGTNGPNIHIYNVHDSASYRDNYTDPTGSFFLNNPAVLELNPKRATSGETDMGLLLMGAQQSGTANTVAILAFLNTALGVSNKRIAQIGVGTDGATDSGLINFTTWNAGTSGLRFSITKSGIKIGNGTEVKKVKHGSTALVAGTKTVTDSDVTANSLILLTSQADGGTPGWLRVSGRTAATSFTITSSSGTDTSTVAWVMIEP